jgi:hypothetical protein
VGPLAVARRRFTANTERTSSPAPPLCLSVLRSVPVLPAALPSQCLLSFSALSWRHSRCFFVAEKIAWSLYRLILLPGAGQEPRKRQQFPAVLKVQGNWWSLVIRFCRVIEGVFGRSASCRYSKRYSAAALAKPLALVCPAVLCVCSTLTDPKNMASASSSSPSSSSVAGLLDLQRSAAAFHQMLATSPANANTFFAHAVFNLKSWEEGRDRAMVEHLRRSHLPQVAVSGFSFPMLHLAA